MKTILKKVLVKLGILNRHKAHNQSIRKDVEVIPIQSKLELVVYWKVLKIGKGPAVTLKAYGKEILKFDCFGKDDGHFHVAPKFGDRIFFEKETASGQIEQTANELNTKAQSYLSRQEENRIRNIRIDQGKLKPAVDRAKKKMNYFLQTIPELEDLR